MDETQKLAMTNLYKEIKHNIENTDPQDKASIAKLDEIKNKSKTYNQFLNYIVDDLDPTYHANINLKPLETPSQNEKKLKPSDSSKLYEQPINKSIDQFSSDIQDSSFPHRPKIVPAQAPAVELQNKKSLMNKITNATPFTKQPEINFGSKNSSFNKSVPQGSQGMVPMMKGQSMFQKSSNDMPPPQNVQKSSKESKILEKCGINESEERQLIENSSSKKVSYTVSGQNLSSSTSEKFILNENIIKSKLEKKLNEYNMKNINSGCIEILNVGFNGFVRNLLTNLEKVAALEKNSETLGGFLKNTENIPGPMKISENQDFKTILLNKRFKADHFSNISFSLLLAPNKSHALKQYESFEKEQQTQLEEKIRSRKLFEAYEEKPVKKNKKQVDESKDIYDILLKNKNEKAKESDNQRKSAEDISRTIDIYLGGNKSSKLSKMNSESKEDQQKPKEVSKTNENKKNSSEKLRITLKTFIHVLEHDPTFRKMPILLKAYMKQN